MDKDIFPMSKKDFTMDFSLFDTTFFKLVENSMPKEAEKGVFKGANLILDLAEIQAPTVPRKIGDLRGSRKVENIVVDSGNISATAGYNIEYAAKLHELPPSKDARINWTLPGSGAKWLEKSLIKNKEKAVKVIVKHINNAKA